MSLAGNRYAIGACVIGMLAAAGPYEVAAGDAQPRPGCLPGERASNRVVIKVGAGVELRGGGALAAKALGGAFGTEVLRLDDALRGDEIVRVSPVFGELGHPVLAHEIGLDRYFLIEVRGNGAGLAERLRELRGAVVSAELDPIGGLSPVDDTIEGTGAFGTAGSVEPGQNFVPSDELFEQQWSLYNTGAVIDGQPGVMGADIDVLSAWELLSQPGGGAPIKVAVLDSGVSSTHPDLVDRLVGGYNTIGNPDDTDDGLNSHGTHVAGIIAAVRDNDIGITGVCERLRIMPIRVFNEFGFGFETQFVQGLTWAVDHGARVASMSIGYPTATSLMYDACAYASGSGVVLVGSTGNTPGQAVQYPARYGATIAVGATDNRDVLWANSTTGPQVTLVAPGVDVISTWDTPTEPATYKMQTGTSQAVPHVSAVVAMLLLVDRDLSPDDIGWILSTAAEDLGPPGWDEQYGYGRLNAGLAVATAMTLSSVGGECRVDYDGDGRFSLEDLSLFIEYYMDADPRADLASPFGAVNAADLDAFVDEVLNGCG